jgi:hypothetical protein
MIFTYRRIFGTHKFEILMDSVVIAKDLKEADAIRTRDALSYYEVSNE